MKKIILLISVLLVAAIIAWRISFKDAALSVKKEKATFELTANELLQQYENDEAAANKKYLNKVITVTGTVGKIETTSESLNIYLQEISDVSGVICGFDPSVASEDKFTLGDTVSIKGLCSGYLFDVVLVKCVVSN